MNFIIEKLALPVGLGLLVGLGGFPADTARAQTAWPVAPPTTAMAQRNALNLVLNQVNWLQNASRTASSHVDGGYGTLMEQFQAVRSQYGALTRTLNEQQIAYGADQLGELAAGLDTIQQAFAAYQTQVANGRPGFSALHNMSRGLDQEWASGRRN